MINREKFFDVVREKPFGGSLTQEQVDGMTALLNVWERRYARDNPRDGDHWLAYALATTYHETAATMRPIEEYGKGEGHDYGEPAGPFDQCYYGRGHVQLTWLENYEKGQRCLKDKFDIDAPLVRHPESMLDDETSALIMFEGLIDGWFTGVGLPDFFNATEEDAYNARKIVNGLDQAELIENYYYQFRASLA